MVNPKQLRARAEECEAKAETAHDPEVRRWYRNMAAQWRELAQQHEELDIDVRLVRDRQWPRRAARLGRRCRSPSATFASPLWTGVILVAANPRRAMLPA